MSLVTNAGIDHILNVEFDGATQVTTWYLGLINNSPSPSLAAADTLASHAGWTESVAYAGNRKAWTNGASSSQSMTNAVTVDFVMSATLTVYGFILCSVASGTSGVLFCEVAFSGGTTAVVSGDTLEVTCTISGASG